MASEVATGNNPPVCLVISSLGSGGAERVMSTLANHWQRSGRSVTLITLSEVSTDFYPLETNVQRVGLGMMKASRNRITGFWNTLTRVIALRRAIRKSECNHVISFMDRTNILVLLACIGLGKQIIVSERIDPRHYPIGSGWTWLRLCLYRHAHAVVVQTKAVADWARKLAAPDRVHVIPNPVLIENARSTQKDEAIESVIPEGPFVLAVGRLDRQKGFDILIEAWTRFSADIDIDIAWKLIIAGEGPERKNLEAQIAAAGANDRILLVGRQSDLAAWYAESGLFVLSSRFEGFPNVLVEAMAAGLPVIATDCPSGPSEIVRHNETGWLVPAENIEALANAFEEFFESERTEEIAIAGRQSVEQFEVSRIAKQWEKLFSASGAV